MTKQTNPKEKILPILATILIALLSSCINTNPTNHNNKQLRIGINSNTPPINYIKNKKPSGLEIELATKLATELHLAPKFITLDDKQLQTALEKEQIDIIISATSITPNKKFRRIITTEPYLNAGLLGILHKTDFLRLGNPHQIKTTFSKIGVIINSEANRYVDQYCIYAKKIYFATAKDAMTDLINKKIDIFIDDAPTIWQLITTHNPKIFCGMYQPLKQKQFTWIIKINNKTLQKNINKIVKKWKKNRYLRKTIKKYLPTPIKYSIPTTNNEK